MSLLLLTVTLRGVSNKLCLLSLFSFAQISGERLQNHWSSGYATLTLMRIKGESHQKYISVSIAKNPGEFYANFRLAKYEVYV